MTELLDHVFLGGPHVLAHNDERDAINDLMINRLATAVPITTDIQNLGSSLGKPYAINVFPNNSTDGWGAFAIRGESDAYPWVFWTGSSFDGLYFGDGTQDPYDFTQMCGNIFCNAGAFFLDGPGTGLNGELGFQRDQASLDLAAPDIGDQRIKLMVKDDRVSLILSLPLAGQTWNIIDGDYFSIGPTGNFSTDGSISAGPYATIDRPLASDLGVSAQIFDTTLGKPIWSNGTDWVDATGAVV